MIINWYGEGCLKIQSGELTILTDPVEAQSGLSPARVKPTITIKTLSPAKNLGEELAEKEGYSIVGPGEYNIQHANIVGFGIPKESTDAYIKTVYMLEIDDITICLLGHISETPSPDVLEHIEEADILFIPGGGAPFLDQKTAVKLVKQIQPKIVVPMFFKIPGLKRKSDEVKTFLEEYGEKKGIETQEKISIKKKELGEIKTTQIIILKP